MRHVYHLPEPGASAADATDDRRALARAVEAAVARGVARAVGGLVADGLVGDGPGPSGEVIQLLRPPARERVGTDSAATAESAASQDSTEGADGQPGARRQRAVPSYQDKGRPVAVPVAPAPGTAPAAQSAPAQHPQVRSFNELAERVRRAEQAPPLVTPAPSAGLFGRMWSRGSAQDTARLLGTSRADLERGQAVLIKAVSTEALRIARVLLDRNEVVVRREASRYGESTPTGPAARLRAAAAEMAALQRQILDRVREVGNAQAAGMDFGIAGPPQAGRPLDAEHFDDVLGGAIARGDARIQRELLPRLNTLKRIYGPEFPILLGRNLDLSKFAVTDPAALARAVGVTTSEVLQSIAKLRDRLTEESVWQLLPVLEAARHVMGVVPGTPAAAAIDGYLAERAKDELIRQLLLSALGITLAIAATVATAGAAAPAAGAGAAALAGGLSLATAGVSVLGAVEHYESYTFAQAAAHSSLDPATALAHEDPSLSWLVVSVLGAVIDVGTAVLAVRNLATVAKLVMASRDLTALEQAVRAQAKVLAAEGRLAGTEQEFVDAVLKAGKQRIGGAAAGSTLLRYGKTVFHPNPGGGSRSLAEAVSLARAHGVTIGDDVLIRIDPTLKAGDFARYGNDSLLTPGARISWASLTDEIRPPKPGIKPTYWTENLIEEPERFVRIRLRPDVLTSDEAIVAVLTHEMHEINHLRTVLGGGNTISGPAFQALVNADSGTLHLQAWVKALEKVEKMRLP